MTSKSTPDERFLIKLYEMAFATGNPLAAMKIQTVATAIGQKETAIKNIIKHLAQANFVIKVDDTRVALTERGCAFVLNLSQ